MADNPPELQAEERDIKQDDQIRATIADTYTFVRSREINKVISNFTFDHYIDEAKRDIKEDRILRTASGLGEGTRPSKLGLLQKLQDDFNKSYAKANELAEASDKGGEQEKPKDVESASLPEETLRFKQEI